VQTQILRLTTPQLKAAARLAWPSKGTNCWSASTRPDQASSLAVYWATLIERRQISLQALGQVAVEAGSRRGRKLLIWIGPGWPALSSTSVDTTGITPREQDALYGAITEISTALWQSRVTLYDIDPSGSIQGQFNYENFVKGADAPRHVDNGDLMLQVLAVQSGGSIQYGNDLDALITRCMEDSKSFYVVHYTMPPAAHANEFHSLEVRVDKPGLKVRSRTLYYGQP
jgi:VWFA-related protein